MVQVSLLHKPTGIRVTCQETRSLQENRRIARRLLLRKVPHSTSSAISPLNSFQAGRKSKPGLIERRAEGRQGARKETATRQKGTEETRKVSTLDKRVIMITYQTRMTLSRSGFLTRNVLSPALQTSEWV